MKSFQILCGLGFTNDDGLKGTSREIITSGVAAGDELQVTETLPSLGASASTSTSSTASGATGGFAGRAAGGAGGFTGGGGFAGGAAGGFGG